MEQDKESNILTPEQFTNEVARIMNLQSSEDKTCLEIILEVCEKFEVEIDDCKAYLSPSLVEILEVESSRFNLLKSKIKTVELF